MSTVDDPYCGHPAPDGGHVGRYVDADPSAVVLTVLGASAIRKAEGSPQRLVLAVPHPTGGPPHLLAANIPPAGADRIRALVRSSRTRSSMVDIDPAAVQSNTALEWWRVSDERDEVTTRRDSARPVAAFDGKTVQVWGCGGLGSWIAEYVVRAGAKKMLLCDPGRISGVSWFVRISSRPISAVRRSRRSPDVYMRSATALKWSCEMRWHRSLRTSPRPI